MYSGPCSQAQACRWLEFPFPLFNWGAWATLCSEVTCVNYSLISPDFHSLPAYHFFAGKSFTSLSPSAVFPKERVILLIC